MCSFKKILIPNQGDLLTIEAMKMKAGIHAEHGATIKAVRVTPGGRIDAKDPLIELEAPQEGCYYIIQLLGLTAAFKILSQSRPVT